MKAINLLGLMMIFLMFLLATPASADVGLTVRPLTSLINSENVIYGNASGGGSSNSLLLLQTKGVPMFRVDLSGNITLPGSISSVRSNSFCNAAGANCFTPSGSMDTTADTIADDGVISSSEVNFNYAGSVSKGGDAYAAGRLNPLSGDSNYKLAYTADGARNNAGEWGRAVMYYVPNGQTYGIRVDRADYSDGAGSASNADTTDGQHLGTGNSPTFYRINATANATSYFCGGDDACLNDVNIANTVGIRGTQNSTIGSIQLGSSGATMTGNSDGSFTLNAARPHIFKGTIGSGDSGIGFTYDNGMISRIYATNNTYASAPHLMLGVEDNSSLIDISSGIVNIATPLSVDSSFDSGRIIARVGGVSLGSGNSSQLEINNAGSGASNISFHREGVYGAHFGLDTDNWFSTYGWSAGSGYTSMRVGSLNARGEIYMAGWLRPDGYTGIYSPNNGAHFYPNNGSYGSWRIAGSRNSWYGLEFDTAAGQTSLMMGTTGQGWGSQTTGVHNNSYGWVWRFEHNRLYASGGADFGSGSIVTTGNVGIGVADEYHVRLKIDGVISPGVYDYGIRVDNAYTGITSRGASAGIEAYGYDVGSNGKGVYAYGALYGVQAYGEEYDFYGSSGHPSYFSGNVLVGNGLKVSNGGSYGSKIQIGSGSTWGSGNDSYINFGDGDRNYAWIGESSADDQLHLYGRNGVWFNTSYVLKPGGGTFADSSDSRLKKDISTLTGTEALDKLDKLNPVTFKWKNPEEHEGVTGYRTGIMAQNLKEVFPDWVQETTAVGKDKDLVDSDGKAYTISYPNDFNAYLIGALKELKKENETLKADNEDLRIRIENIENKLK